MKGRPAQPWDCKLAGPAARAGKSDQTHATAGIRRRAHCLNPCQFQIQKFAQWRCLISCEPQLRASPLLRVHLSVATGFPAVHLCVPAAFVERPALLWSSRPCCCPCLGCAFASAATHVVSTAAHVVRTASQSRPRHARFRIFRMRSSPDILFLLSAARVVHTALYSVCVCNLWNHKVPVECFLFLFTGAVAHS